jgi:hypothetical protein
MGTILDFGHYHLTVGYRQRLRNAKGKASPTVQVLDFGLVGYARGQAVTNPTINPAFYLGSLYL